MFTKVISDAKQLYPRLLMTDLAFKVVSAVFLIPALSWIYNRLISASGGSAVSNTDIIAFFLTPAGILYLAVGSIFTIALIFAEMTGLLTIAFGALHGRILSWRQVLKLTWNNANQLLRLGAALVSSLLLLIMPVAIVGGLLYLRNLTTYDINYYLKTTPPEFWWTIVIATPFIIILVVGVGALVAAALFAHAKILFEGIPARQALRESRDFVMGSRWRIIRLAFSLTLAVLVGAILLQFVLSALSTTLLSMLSNRLAFFSLVLGMVLLVNFVVSYLISFLGISVISLMTARLYDEFSQQHSNVPQLPQSLQTQSEPLVSSNSARLVIFGSLAGLVVAGLIGWAVISGIDYTDDVTITAHRGSSVAAPPNTLASVQQAIDDGADYAEIDVQEALDGVVIVNHDSDFMLAAGVPLAVHEAAWAEVQTLDVGTPFAPEFAGEGVPTLAQVLELAKDKIKVNIELKYYGQDRELAKRVVDVVRAAGMEEQVLIMSLHYEGTQEVRELAPEISVGFLASVITVGDLTDLNVDFLAVDSGLASLELIRNSHNKGKELFVWTINNETDMSVMIDRGVDSIITDYPAMMVDVLAERAQMSQAERLLLSVSDRLTQ